MKNIIQDVENNVNWLSQFGAVPSGGITRLLYTKEWFDAQQALKSKFEDIGLDVSFDEVGNLSGRLTGSQYPEQVIMSGSHVDSVVNGGNLDGHFGIIAAYLAIQYLKEKYGTPLRTLEVISLAEEEGSRFPYVFWGSKNLFGLAKKEDVQNIKDGAGVSFTDAMRGLGFNFKQDETAARKDIKAFVELHIEQGSVLENEGNTIGVVNSIVGQRRYNITLKGQANHAGTTPMRYRKDAVYGFSRICTESIAKAEAAGDPLVLTFGKVVPKPNTVNVVPGEVMFTMDCRHTDQAYLKTFTEEIEHDMRAIAKEMGMEIEIDRWMDEAPVPMDPQLVDTLKNICDKEQLNYRVMHSGAGHDAQIFAPRVPTAMLFIPSIKGISHNPAEKTKTEDLVEGVKALTQALYQLAYQD
ncbi:allantoate deiminase [Pragia fontium]|uniref:Allantoate deiminase n=2 Tax=Pragia fontium TaxID=82985 RepID=A0AAJ5BH15_9GAMM|nr:allantoate deiminase [Pragia fontium]AKJ42500.1 allantoate amidohydrolase [Pragia fontium]SFC74757.1 allantoate deiminase [Pragia fontium DSM 5563 = ATCC 49100]SUB82816.1 Allantoate amidohydrolase [Pragia fontium]VEJ55714.1 Allantoate amidohydrolase [Pragia fontium]